MDITQARTFLAVLETGSFLHAAERVNVAQSTVSTRIRALEDALGQELFIRNKSGATPTPVGREFARHAAAIVRMWDQARLTLALPEDQQRRLTLGGQPSLWDGFLLRLLPWLRTHMPELAVRAQMTASSPALMQQLLDGLLDMAVLYRPVARPGIIIRQIFEEHLVLVTSDKHSGGPSSGNYIFVDWGPEFQADHALNFPDNAIPPLNLNVGSLGISFLLENKASGYFPERIAAPFLAQGDLTLVAHAPSFTYPVYAAYPEDHDAELMATIFEGIETVAQRTPTVI
ncbi:LysR family transcriptional regulator [Kordiimonas gwangyangensis]|uniref:LysR family transcriptional regulator n=1 Tax=Kordiimonas gwangyangensis TaxID=288022 RepID=UPI000363B2F9|nr:LysR family transcriptional regulator [Kordiimonas gwangyangensis]